jgi:DNA ligase 4
MAISNEYRLPTPYLSFDVGLDYKRELQPADLFKHPFPVELMGASFDKPANTMYFTLRFPPVLKIHRDRSFKDTISFEELQEMAKRYNGVLEDTEGEDSS